MVGWQIAESPEFNHDRKATLDAALYAADKKVIEKNLGVTP
jgi:hypothetical protein